MDILDKPERIYNVDEKGCRLTLHHQQKVLAQKGARRVHVFANEHGESVTIVSCGNALGTAISQMALFKGKRSKPEWVDSLPPGAVVQMTAKDTDSSNSDLSFSLHDSSSDKVIDSEDDHSDFSNIQNTSFTIMLESPENAAIKNDNKKPRKPAINCRAQVVTKDLFGRCIGKSDSENIKANTHTTDGKRVSSLLRKTQSKNKFKTLPAKKNGTKKQESWFCKLCKEDRMVNMRLCSVCSTYIHEEYMGLTTKDKIGAFLCPDCEN
ncbi:unnamed protein product [Diabrotica balteata]|uniref:Uncharacterized protein n=1 Tax=Diabrotica balteata TaxID=107213 RepID=A0A9N9XCM0_DIABA|nr:unnamed protein product [Diabrotica balteata]